MLLVEWQWFAYCFVGLVACLALVLRVVKDSTSSCSSCNNNYITTTSLVLMNFIMSYDRDLIGFRLHEQKPAIQ